MDTENQYYSIIFVRYFLLTFTISIVIWSFIPLTASSNPMMNLWIAILGLFGPSISGLILSYRFHGTYWQHYVPRLIYFLPLLGISCLIGFGYMVRLEQNFSYYTNSLTFFVMAIIFLCCILTSYFISLMIRPPPGFETRNDKPFQIQSQMGMLMFALFIPLIIGVLSFYIQLTIFPDSISYTLPELISTNFQLPLFLIPFSFLFSGAANEEIGWRGYLTPKALQRLTPLSTGLMIGFFWSLWHLPLYIVGFYAESIDGIWFRFAWNIPMGIVFTWYYIKSGYNLLGAILLHGAFNLFSFIGEFYIIPAYVVTALIMIYEQKMWKSPYKQVPK